VRNRKEDELPDFVCDDDASFCEMKGKLLANDRNLPAPVFSFMDGEILHLQSTKLVNGVPAFITRISPDQTFESFHLGVRCTVLSLSKNRITQLKTWSSLEENIRYLKYCEIDGKKKEVLQQQLHAMGPQQVGKPRYTPDTIIRAFQYFATSR